MKHRGLRRWSLLIAIAVAGASALALAQASPAGTRSVHFWDLFCLFLMFLLPLVFVLRWNLIGVVAGAILFWGIGVAAGRIAQALDPRRDVAMLDSVWVIFGLAGGLLYCVPIYLLKLLVRWLRRKDKPDEISELRLLTR
jgi:hypothetical protein